jgi:hypothetical protein
MSKSPMPVHFRNADERDRWITDNADYFTVIRRQNLKTIRNEAPDLETARKLALGIIKDNPKVRLIIYAVHGQMSAYVKTLSWEDWVNAA